MQFSWNKSMLIDLTALQYFLSLLLYWVPCDTWEAKNCYPIKSCSWKFYDYGTKKLHFSFALPNWGYHVYLLNSFFHPFKIKWWGGISWKLWELIHHYLVEAFNFYFKKVILCAFTFYLDITITFYFLQKNLPWLTVLIIV
jgi:hypothetical protein